MTVAKTTADTSVLLLPFFNGNQYQELLREGLESRGVNVSVDDRPLPLKPFLHRLLLNDVDVVHVHWTHPYFLFGSKRALYSVPLARYVCKLAAWFFVLQMYAANAVSRKVVWTAHNKCNHERRYEEIDRWVGRWMVTIADDVQVWDDATREELESYLGIPLKRTTVIPHGNYVDLYEGGPVPKEQARAELELDGYDRIYLYFGRIRPYKGVPDLIRAFDELDDENACLVVAGTPMYDDLQAEIEALAAETPNVKLVLEYVPDEAVPTYFGACDFAVFPYEHIFNSGSVILAMSLGRAFVAPHTGSIPTVSPEGNVLYEGDLTAALRAANDISTAEVERIGEQNRTVAISNHNWGTIVERTLEVYRS